MRDKDKYFTENITSKNFSVHICLSKTWKYGNNFKEHWHEYLQIFYFIDGNGIIICNKKSFNISKDDVFIVNSKELHSIESKADNFKFYLFIIHLPFLFSNQIDLCQTKYLSPLSENSILFKNLIRNDTKIIYYINKIIDEYFSNEIGHELSVKAYLYNLIVLLLRKHINKFLTPNQLCLKLNNTNRYSHVFEYIDNNYNKKIDIALLAKLTHLSPYYFCRIFKDITGKTTSQYVNEVRLQKAIIFLKESDKNITEIAISCGFNDVNYFSRLFKKKYGISPSKYTY